MGNSKQRYQSQKKSGSTVEQRANYHAFLVRMWRDDSNAPWRFSVQDSAKDERVGFADLDGLFAYLWNLARDSPE